MPEHPFVGARLETTFEDIVAPKERTPAPLQDGAFGFLSTLSVDVFSARLVAQVFFASMLLRVTTQALGFKVVPEGTFDLLDVLGLDESVGGGVATCTSATLS